MTPERFFTLNTAFARISAEAAGLSAQGPELKRTKKKQQEARQMTIEVAKHRRVYLSFWNLPNFLKKIVHMLMMATLYACLLYKEHYTKLR